LPITEDELPPAVVLPARFHPMSEPELPTVTQGTISAALALAERIGGGEAHAQTHSGSGHRPFDLERARNLDRIIPSIQKGSIWSHGRDHIYAASTFNGRPYICVHARHTATNAYVLRTAYPLNDMKEWAASDQSDLAIRWCRDWCVAWTRPGLEPGRHPLDALAIARQQHSGAVAARRGDAVRMAKGCAKCLDIGRNRDSLPPGVDERATRRLHA
jgi:hypothetical protein